MSTPRSMSAARRDDRPLRVYLAGKVPKDDNVGGGDWRSAWAARLGVAARLEFLDADDPTLDESRPQEVFGHDCLLVRSCDVVVVNATGRIGAGTAQEMLIAKLFAKPVLTVLPPGTHHRRNVRRHGVLVADWKHPFVVSTSDFVFDDVAALAHFLGGGPDLAHPKTLAIVDDAIAAYLRAAAHASPTVRDGVNVTISGLTGAGKTTVAQRVAQALGLSYVSGSQVRARLVGLAAEREQAERRFWLESPDAVEADARRMRVGLGEGGVEAELARMHDGGDDQAFDVWFLPWVAQRPSLRVWLDAPLRLRVERVAAQLGALDALPRVAADVTRKDENSRAYGLKEYSIDIYGDRSPFDIVVDVTSGVPAATLSRLLSAAACAWTGQEYPELTAQDRHWAARALAQRPTRLEHALGLQ